MSTRLRDAPLPHVDTSSRRVNGDGQEHKLACLQVSDHFHTSTTATRPSTGSCGRHPHPQSNDTKKTPRIPGPRVLHRVQRPRPLVCARLCVSPLRHGNRRLQAIYRYPSCARLRGCPLRILPHILPSTADFSAFAASRRHDDDDDDRLDLSLTPGTALHPHPAPRQQSAALRFTSHRVLAAIPLHHTQR